MLLLDAKNALHDVIATNERLFSGLDVERFFYCVRPYYKPYRVGRQEYRGANAGDFSAINEIDLLLGLCRANDPYYAQLLVDKMLFLLPSDQARLRDCMARTSLLDEFLSGRGVSGGELTWFQQNAAAFLEVCELYGRTAAQHHDNLVEKFIRQAGRSAAGDAPRRHHRQRPAAACVVARARGAARSAARCAPQRHSEPACMYRAAQESPCAWQGRCLRVSCP